MLKYDIPSDEVKIDMPAYIYEKGRNEGREGSLHIEGSYSYIGGKAVFTGFMYIDGMKVHMKSIDIKSNGGDRPVLILTGYNKKGLEIEKGIIAFAQDSFGFVKGTIYKFQGMDACGLEFAAPAKDMMEAAIIEERLKPGTDAMGIIKGGDSRDGYWPTNGWRVSTPERQGMDSEKIYEMFKYIKESGLDVHSLLIVRNGYLVTEGYFYPFKKGYKHVLNSCTKSITSALVGALLDDGDLDSIENKVLDIFSGMRIQNADDRKKNMTVKHLLTMTSGLDWNEDGSYGLEVDSNTRMWDSENQLQFALDCPMRGEPGSEFYYCTGGSHILSAVVQELSKKSLLQYAKEKLFDHMGIGDISCWVDNQGIYSGGGGMFLKPEDMAKFGYLYLKKGIWEGEQLISSKWVEESTSLKVDTPNGLAGKHGYGYQWWRNRIGGYSARGFSGQYILVLPEHELVVVFTCGLKGRDFYKPEELVEDYIIPAIKSSEPIEENKESCEALYGMLNDISKIPSPKALSLLPETAYNVSGKTYSMDNGEKFRFEFKSLDEYVMHWSTSRADYSINIGLDGLYRENFMKDYYTKDLDAIGGFRGNWTDKDKFIVCFKLLEDADSYTMEFIFNGDILNSVITTEPTGLLVADSWGKVFKR